MVHTILNSHDRAELQVCEASCPACAQHAAEELERKANLQIAAAADLEAAARYDGLAEHNPSLRREYSRAAALCRVYAETKMTIAGGICRLR